LGSRDAPKSLWDWRNREVAREAQEEAPGRPAKARPSLRRRQRFVLQNLTEQRVLKSGLGELRRRLRERRTDEKLLSFPRRANGTAVMLRESFFERLLSGEVDFRSLMASDLTEAQRDIRYLTLPQLLAIRTGCLDFHTESSTHRGHRNFLGTVDRLLSEKIAVEMLCGLEPSGLGQVQKLGLRLALVLGAGVELPSLAKLPSSIWALPVEPEEWGGCDVALFDSQELSVQACKAGAGAVAEILANRPVNVIWDGSASSGQSRAIYWEVSPVDPPHDDLLKEMHKSSQAGGTKALNGELFDVIALRGRHDSEEGLKNSVASAIKIHRSRSLKPLSSPKDEEGDRPKSAPDLGSPRASAASSVCSSPRAVQAPAEPWQRSETPLSAVQEVLGNSTPEVVFQAPLRGGLSDTVGIEEYPEGLVDCHPNWAHFSRADYATDCTIGACCGFGRGRPKDQQTATTFGSGEGASGDAASLCAIS